MYTALAAWITNIFGAIVHGLGSIFKTSMPEYCTLATADTDFSLVTSEGRLVSGFRIEGVVSALGADEFEALMGHMGDALRPFMKDKAHTIQFFGFRDPDGIADVLAEANRGSRSTLKALSLKLEDVLDSRERNMANFCSDEAQYIAVWTHPDVIPAPEYKAANAERMTAAKKMPSGYRSLGAQDFFGTLFAVREAHTSFVRSIAATISNAGVRLTSLTSHEMLRTARRAMDPGFTSPQWKACLPGDPVPGILRGADVARPLTFGDVQYPPISWQLFPRDAKKIKGKFIELGDRVFAPVFIETTPQEIKPFADLLERLHNAGVPWRASFTIDGGGLNYISLKGGLAKMLTWASAYNAKISESVTAMRAHAVEGATYVRIKIAFCTWAPAGEMETLRSRVSKLVHTVQAWGDCEVREVVGDPMAGFFSTIPFLGHTSAANPSVGPISHILRMTPIARQDSPWKNGSVLYRTRDGKLIPFEPGSSLQDTWNYILFAPPGSGKSVQMGNLLLAAALQPGISQIPRIGIVDIGPSSKGLMNLIRGALPPSERHKVAYIRLRNTPEFAINPFDTFLGCRYPTPDHKAFLVNLLTQITTPAERSTSYSSISEIASQVVDNIYKEKSDATRANPNQYERNAEPSIDKALDAIGFQTSRTMSWWTVVDALFDNNYLHEATLAQRHAVPTLADIPAAAKEQSIVDQYATVHIETTESLNSSFSRLVQSGLRMYPLMAGKTTFDLGEIRIAALDIDEVAKSGSIADDRQTALMYLMAHFILTRDYKLDAKFVQDSPSIPDRYREYLRAKAQANKENMKWICYDEFHRTAKSPAVQNEVLVSMREGRKWNLGVILASQSIDDFPDAIKEFATAVFILKAANHKVADQLQKLFGLNDTTRAMVLKYCNGPDPRQGAPMLVHFMLKSGVADMMLYSTLGAYEMWALSTTAEDTALLERVTDGLASTHFDSAAAVARAALAKRYPGGSKSKVEDIKRSMMDSLDGSEAEMGAIAILAKQVLASILV